MLGNTTPRYRPDIDGLRAIAVLLVVGYHAFPGRVRGGFIGVDVFFVVSGYLISTIILGSLDRGAFSFTEFYARRIRRIFPALILVLIATLIFGWLALFPGEYEDLGKLAAASAAFVPNIVLWRETKYFAVVAELKPLLHTWSLGIEEQFYLVWPFLAWVISRNKRTAGLAMIAMMLGSFALNVMFIDSKPIATFNLPFTRWWELMAGAYLARRDLGAEAEPPANNLRSFAGLGLIVAAAALMDRGTRFPGFAALAPVVGTCLLIPRGQSAAWLNRRVLSDAWIVRVGLISYPLYLWHWPMLSFARLVEPGPPSIRMRLVLVASSVVLAIATYLLIERPLKRSHARAAIAGSLLPLLAATGFAGFMVYETKGVPSRFGVAYSDMRFVDYPAPITAECRRRYGMPAYCMLSSLTIPPTVMVLGDSHARALFLGLSDYYRKRGRELVHFGENGCAPFPGFEARCSEIVLQALEELEKRREIDTVVIVAAYAHYTDKLRSSGSLPGKPEDNFRRGLDALISRIEGLHRQVIFVHQVPVLDFDARTCLPRAFEPEYNEACRVPVAFPRKRFAKYKRLAADVLRSHPDVIQVDPMNGMCDELFCYAKRNGEILYYDRGHLSLAGSRYAERWLEEALTPSPAPLAGSPLSLLRCHSTRAASSIPVPPS